MNWTGHEPPARPVDHIFGGRQQAIREGRCIEPPIGCGQKLNLDTTTMSYVFRDDASQREYLQTGMCQHCQDKFYGG